MLSPLTGEDRRVSSRVKVPFRNSSSVSKAHSPKPSSLRRKVGVSERGKKEQ